MRNRWIGILLACVTLTAAPYDRYGGWTELGGRKSGFFHTERIGGRWWLVTPDGNVFFSKGVCHVSMAPESDSSPPPPADLKGWAQATARQLRGWGLNTVGAWSAPELYSAGMVYTHILNLAASLQRDLWLKGGVVDVFGPEFRNAVDRAAAATCPKFAADPWLLGYFTDNELRWGPDWRSRESLLESYLKMDPASMGYRTAAALLKSRGRGPASMTEEDKAAFLQMAASEYGRVSREAIRRYDPNHLVLGCRFAGYANEAVLKGVGPHFDVVSYNNYSPKAPVDRLRQITGITGKPVMLTEFSFKAMDSGLPNTKGAAKPVATQEERAGGFAAYVRDLASLPGCVGYHWFQYRDQPGEGRRLDSENSNYGLVKLDGTPWELLTRRFQEVNRELEARAAGAR